MSLEVEGYDVVTASDGERGLEELSRQPSDIILLDLQMPRMDGRTFYKEMKSRGFDIPVLILSAYGAEADVQTGMAPGVPVEVTAALDSRGSSTFRALAWSQDDDTTDEEEVRRLVDAKRQWILEKLHHPQKYQDRKHPPGKEVVNGERKRHGLNYSNISSSYNHQTLG